MAPRQFKVLLADDLALELEIERTFFQRGGFTVITATDGREAVNLAVTERPDIVILDEVMPDLKGTDICRMLKACPETCEIPVIITSAIESPEIENACVSAGAHAFVGKSLGREELLRHAALILQVPERRQARVTVFFTVQGIVGAKESLGRGVDLSESGLRLETNVRYAPNTYFKVRFLVPGERSEIHGEAKLVRMHEQSDKSYIMNLEFSEMSPHDRHRLNHYIDRTLTVR